MFSQRHLLQCALRDLGPLAMFANVTHKRATTTVAPWHLRPCCAAKAKNKSEKETAGALCDACEHATHAHARLPGAFLALLAFARAAFLVTSHDVYISLASTAVLLVALPMCIPIRYIVARVLLHASPVTGLAWDTPWLSSTLQACWAMLCYVTRCDDNSGAANRIGETHRIVARTATLTMAILATASAYDAPAEIMSTFLDFAVIALVCLAL